ncbi:MAG: VOC family protein [Clostridiales bacterium]|nr:VOC family protein [Clostridiales bacterium]
MIFNKLIPELTVSNLQESINFYVGLLGFEIKYERKENLFTFLELEDIQIMIQEHNNEDEEKWNVGKLEYPYGRGINFQIELNNIDNIYNRLIENNYPIAFDIEKNWYRQNDILLGNKEFLVQDPDGYLLRFCEDLGEKEIKEMTD